MAIEPYLFFNGRCEEAIEFYKKALGAEVLMMMRFKESPEPPAPGMVPPGSDNKIMHLCMRIGDANIMASDGHCTGQTSFQGFSLSLTAATKQSLRLLKMEQSQFSVALLDCLDQQMEKVLPLHSLFLLELLFLRMELSL